MPRNQAIPEREDVIQFSERSEESWRQYFAEFREKVWPMFKEHGFTPFEAWSAWQSETIIDRLDQIKEALADKDSF